MILCVIKVFSPPHEPYYLPLQLVSQPQILGSLSPGLVCPPAIDNFRPTAADGVHLDLCCARQYLSTSSTRKVGKCRILRLVSPASTR
jgi:hypothetical protein